MKKTLYILNILLGLVTIPMLTSWLLDWEWITRHWTREVLVIFFMILEIVILAFILKLIVEREK